MRSSTHLRREIALRRRALERQRELGDHLEGWGGYAYRRAVDDLARAESDLARLGGDLEWEFSGAGVREDGRISLKRFESILAPLAMTMRWTARDILFVEGMPQTGATLEELVDPVFAGTFAGSFGIRLERNPVAEQGSFFAEPIFDRTAERVLDIYRAARGDDPIPDVLDTLNGLRKNTLTNMSRLSQRLVDAGRPAVIRWHGESVLTVTPEDAAVVVAAISDATPSEEVRTIDALLIGGDYASGTFHLRESLPQGDRDLRGKAEPEARVALDGMVLNRRVRATLVVLTVDSPVLERPKETFLLRAISLYLEP
jgi:hypothetical protein